MSKWQLVSPAGMATGDVLRPAPRPNSLEGKTILLRWNGKHNGDVFLNRIAELIWRNIKGAKVLKGWELAPETAIGSISPRTSREFAARFAALKPDIVIGSTADWGSCTTWLVVDQLNLERLGIPTVSVVTSAFVGLAKAVATSEHAQEICYVSVPHPVGMIPAEEVVPKADEAFAGIVAAATRPVAQEAGSAARSPYPSERIEFEGTLQALNRHFFDKGWSLGLPIMPPTVEAVADMLSGTARDPGEVLGEVPPQMDTLTVELVAASAAMAGCLPEHMPLLLAIMEALLDIDVAWRGALTTTATTQTIAIVNGPIVKQLGLASSTGAAGKGHHPNAAIGYAMNLIAYIVGGSRPPVVDKSMLGSPADFVCWVFGENEEQLPPGWSPLHVERGFQQTDSVVTVMSSYPPIDDLDHWSSTAEQHINWLGHLLTPLMGTPRSMEEFRPLAALGPERAHLIAAGGMSKLDFARALIDRARTPLSAWPPDCNAARNYVGRNLGSTAPDTLVPIAFKAEQLLIAVAGGEGKHSHYFFSFDSLPVSRIVKP